MPVCEMCGKAAPLLTATIEGVDLKVCSNCGKFGRIKKGIPAAVYRKPILRSEEPEWAVVENYAFLLRSAREQKKMTQEEFARFLQEKESSLTKWEAGTVKPSLEAAGMIEKKLRISLLKREEAASATPNSSQRKDELTLGDFIKLKRRK